MKDFTVGKESSLIFYFAVPLLLGNVFQQSYTIIESFIVGNYLGKESLGAVGAAFPLIFLLISLVIGIGSGFSIVIAQYFGAKDLEKVKLAIDTTYIVLFFASILTMVTGLLFSNSFFHLIKLPHEIIPYATLYFNIFIAGIISMFGFNGTNAILRGLGDSKTPLYFLIISTLINIALDFIFILVFHWGLGSIAVATVIAQTGAFGTAVIYLNKNHKIIRISLFRLKFDRDVFLKSLKIGLPSGIQQALVAMGMMALYRIVNDFGTNAVAAYSVATRIDTFATLPAMNFSIALSSFVGQNIGAGKNERVKKGMISTFMMISAISIITSIIAVLAGKEMMSFFTPDVQVISIGADYLMIVGAFYLLFSTIFVFNGVFRGSGDTLIPMFITLVALWLVRIPVSYLLSQKFGLKGIWWGIPAGWTVGTVFSAVYYNMGRWKLKSIIRH